MADKSKNNEQDWSPSAKLDAPLDRVMGRDGFSPDLPAALSRRAGAPRSSLAVQLMLYMLRGLRIGSLEVNLPNGERRVYQGSERPELHGVLNVRSEKLMAHVLRGGEVGFGEAYLDGCWDSPDLASLLAVMYLNEPYYKGPYEKNWLGRLHGWWQHRRRANTRAGARENIQYHYDLGNEFYKMWLDETMAYSSAMFIEPNQTLQDAQLNKFRLMYERLELQPEHHLLEIGSGWGGFAIHAAQQSGCRVTSITLSDEQLKEARLRAEQAGVADRVRFELRDYRDVKEQYDRVVSIEMYEAVGEEYWPVYFAAIARALKPGGRAAIQGITIDESIFEQYRSKRDFIQKYIFPGGMLCAPQRFMQLAAGAGLRAVEPRYYARDYADTLAHWHRNVLAVREKIVEQFDERFLRMWRYYLAYCECGFRVERVDLMHLSLEKSL
ncbi:MAG TPA: cyclopropane-fatty-acyl-phospholipid synthase family protein [Solimonas sp.]|nr:cyclopropane-fatty-acyl-phospholipid synthase family protein [Solimonas sp.]